VETSNLNAGLVYEYECFMFMFFCAAPTAAKIAAVTRPGLLYGLALLRLIFDHSFIPRRNLSYDKPIMPMHCR